ncbi:MAG: hypothetical protein IT377_15065 [Polyangiaceae bacterium]|nr:hypothetical protein [Polyangiaceae bacterium]
MTRIPLRFLAPVIPLAVLCASACNKDKPTGATGETKSSASPVASAAPSPAGSDDPRAADPGAVCSSGERKVLAKWANRRTGITPVQMGDTLALGVAVGNKPRLVMVDKQGKAEMMNVSVADGSDLASDIPKNEGKRDLQRVTPFKTSDGKMSAYADYRDKYESKRRRIACELAANKQVVLAFDGKPLIDSDKKKDAPKDAPKEAAAPPPSGAPPAVAAAAPSAGGPSRRLRMLSQPGLAAAPKLDAPAADAGKPEAAKVDAPKPEAKAGATDEKKKALREIRDCRTFVDADGDVWGLGSELYGEPQADESVKWSMRLFVQPNAAGGYYMLDSIPLPKDPKELHTWESPAAAERADGSIALTARYRGTLVSFLLNKDHKPTGKVKSYRGGWPGMVEFTSDGSNLLLLTSYKVTGDNHEVRIGRLGDGLPANLDRPAIEGVDASLSEPSLAISGGKRWLMLHAGKRREARLVVMPVDESLKPTGKSYDVASGGSVADSRLFPLDGGKVLAVYIQASKDSGDELVSQVLTCNVKS